MSNSQDSSVLDHECAVSSCRTRRFSALLAISILLAALISARPAAPAHAVLQVGDGQRGLNVQTLFVQANIIYDHPTAVGTGEPQSSYTYLAGLGHKLIRLNINWDYLQPNLDSGNRTFHAAYWTAIKAEVAKIKAAGMRTVLDLHNGCEWRKPKTSTIRLCGAGLTTTDTTDVWRQLSAQFKNETSVVAYDLFNEPLQFNHPTRTEVQKREYQPYSTYKTHVNAVVAAIRANSDSKTIWVESLCCHWSKDLPDTDPSGGWVVDPLSKIVYSLHMYPVTNSTAGEAYNEDKEDPNYQVPAGDFWADYGYNRGFLSRLDRFGDWCVAHTLRCSIGEVGWYSYGQTADSAAKWNELGDIWYYKANYFGFDVTYFSATSAYHEGLTAYDSSGPDTWLPAAGINRKQAQATILEKSDHLSR